MQTSVLNLLDYDYHECTDESEDDNVICVSPAPAISPDDNYSYPDNYVGNYQLYQDLIRHNVPHSTVDVILKILKSYTNPNDILTLPASFATAIGPYPKFDVDEEIDYFSSKEAPDDGDNVNNTCISRGKHFRNKKKRKNRARIENSRASNAKYIYFGMKPNILNNPKCLHQDLEKFNNLDINVDGVQPFTSSNKEFWPLLASINGTRIFVVLLWFGRGKPKNNIRYMRKFVDE